MLPENHPLFLLLQAPFNFFSTWCKVWWMDANLTQFIKDLWQYKPVIIVLLVGGFLIFVLSVIDTHRHRKKVSKKRHHPKQH
jgi:hypothetical protein